MGKLLLTGVDGNLGQLTADVLLTLEPVENLIFCGYSEESLKKYAEKGIETHVTNFNNPDGLAEAFKGADALALISMPFVGAKRQNAHKNAVDAAKAAGVKQIIYTSLVNADDETNPSVEKKDHIYTEKYIQEVGLDYQFMRNSQYAEAMVTNYFTYAHKHHHKYRQNLPLAILFLPFLFYLSVKIVPSINPPLTFVSIIVKICL